MKKLSHVVVALTMLLASGATIAQMCVQPPEGLVSWWPGEGNANDIADGGNHGALTGGAAFAPGIVGEAFTISGTGDDFVRVPSNITLEPTTLTVDAWVRADGSPGVFRYVVAKGAEGCLAASYAIYTGPTGGLSFYIFDGVEFVASPDVGPEIWDGEWHHVAGTYDGAFVRLYVDGFEIGAGTPTDISIGYGLSTDNDLVVGQYLDLGSCPVPVEFAFAGDIDEVDVFNVALSATEVQAIYDADSAGKCQELPVDIDIRPRSDTNTIPLSRAGVIPVAVFSSDEFDATDIDPLTIEISAPELKIVTDTSAPAVCGEKDVNADDLIDLVCLVNTVESIIELGETVAELTAETFDGLKVKGQDFVRIVLDPVVVSVDQDSWLKQAAPRDNFGKEKELPVKRKRGDSERAVFHFDLSAIPKGAKIRSARARFRATNPDRRPINIHRITDAWTESRVNWGNTGNDYDSTIAGSFTPSKDDAYYTVDLTSLVQDWVCGTPNHGLMFIATSDDLQSKFASRESDTRKHRPRMKVTFGSGPSPCSP